MNPVTTNRPTHCSRFSCCHQKNGWMPVAESLLSLQASASTPAPLGLLLKTDHPGIHRDLLATVNHVNAAQSEAELPTHRRSVNRDNPFGDLSLVRPGGTPVRSRKHASPSRPAQKIDPLTLSLRLPAVIVFSLDSEDHD
jgi:hypothetical protein